MKVLSRHFGEIEVTDEQIIYFSDGIPGFEDDHKHILITNDNNNNDNSEDEDSVFCWLQSATNPEVSFVLLNPSKVFPDYKPELNDADIESLYLNEATEYVLLNIVVIPESTLDMTANLLAPIIINFDKKIGKQVILDNNDYTVRHRVFDNLKKHITTN